MECHRIWTSFKYHFGLSTVGLSVRHGAENVRVQVDGCDLMMATRRVVRTVSSAPAQIAQSRSSDQVKYLAQDVSNDVSLAMRRPIPYQAS